MYAVCVLIVELQATVTLNMTTASHHPIKFCSVNYLLCIQDILPISNVHFYTSYSTYIYVSLF